ncbi:hypothetical protein SDC9_175315 [bioreactor metagenome]|uniref:Uncharacterized protein n=1 Tax=bioreactor metagenome TaxID=1076179 RepID=A0A645GLQ9_9ZZZZ
MAGKQHGGLPAVCSAGCFDAQKHRDQHHFFSGQLQRELFFQPGGELQRKQVFFFVVFYHFGHLRGGQPGALHAGAALLQHAVDMQAEAIVDRGGVPL